jgi:CRISPR/Cas system CMR-associated protein Cmr1 (group 7 of RAMP superfamily)
MSTTKGFIQKDQEACDRMEAEHLAELGVICTRRDCGKIAVKSLPIKQYQTIHILCAEHLAEHKADERFFAFAALRYKRSDA